MIRCFTRLILLLFFLSSPGFAQNTITAKELRKLNQAKKRFVDPHSIFICGGIGFFQNQFFGTSPGLHKDHTVTGTFYGKVELGLKKGYFVETGLERDKYIATYQYSNFTGLGGYFFPRAKLSLGLSKRIVVGKYAYNLINIHAGLGISFHHNRTGSGGSGYTASITEYFGSYECYYDRAIVFPTLYLVVEKDFQLLRDLYISLSYRYDQGFRRVAEVTGAYTTQPYTIPSVPFHIWINGLAQTLNFGLKYKIVPCKQGKFKEDRDKVSH